ncbi:MAG TPA: TetR/AcrR family transcriptional regulator [Trebonia sp.]
MPTPRERARESTRAQARQIASRQLADGGIESLSLKAIAAELGLTGPAIYRYFANRNELLTELITGAYDDLAAALHAAAQAAVEGPGESQVRAVAGAFREWGRAQPHLFRLLYTAPVPGYDANAGPLASAAQRSLDIFLRALARAAAGRPVRPPLGPTLAAQLPGDPDVTYRGITGWSRLYGFVALEIEGAFASMGMDAGPLYQREIEALIAL